MLGAYRALWERRVDFPLVGASGVSGAAGVAAAAGLGVDPAVLDAVVARASSRVLMQPALVNLQRALTGKMKGFTGIFRGKPWRDLLQKALGDRKFSECKIPIEIPAFNQEKGEIVVFSPRVTPEVSIPRAVRASSAIPILFEAEAWVDGTPDHYNDPAVGRPLQLDLLEQVNFDLLFLVISDKFDLTPMPDLMRRDLTPFHLLYRSGSQGHRDAVTLATRTALDLAEEKGARVLLLYPPKNVPLVDFTTEDIQLAAQAAYVKAAELLRGS